MRGDNHLLAVTTATDEVTNEVKPLFSFPVQLCKATDDGGDVRWDNATPSGAPTAGLLRLDPVTGEAFGTDEVRKGVFVGDEFREVPAENIDAIAEATKVKTMVVTDRIDLTEAWAKFGCRVVGNYFVQSPAKGGSPKAYRLTYEALREVKKGKTVKTPARAIIVKRTAKSRQQLGFIYADEATGCLRFIRVGFAAQQREPDEQILAPQTAEVDEAQIAKARQMIDQFPGNGANVLDTEVDEAVALRAELVQKAVDGEVVVAPPKPVAEKAESDDLMAALEASIA